MTDNTRGALFMVICMAGFSFNDAMIKLAVTQAEIGLFQAIFIRGLFASALLGSLWFSRGTPVRRLPRSDAGWLSLRLLGEVGGTLCFLTAIFKMPLANATAILQVMPLAVTLAAAFFLGEKVGWRRYTAIGIGLFGMLIIVRPGSATFDSHSLWAVAACGFMVLRDLSTRQLSSGLPSAFVAFATAMTIAAVGGLVSVFLPWSPVSLQSLLILAVAAGFLLGGYLFGVMAVRVGEVGAVAPFRYSILIWATLLGIGVFGDWPDTATILGATLLVATGVYSFRRDQLAAPVRAR